MTVTAQMVMTRGGAVLALDQSIADAVMHYARQTAEAEGMAPQAWCRKRWKLAEYEAKHVLRGDCSKTIYERILKLRGPHCGWPVAIAVTGAVVGQDLSEFFRAQMRQAAKEAQRALEHEQFAKAAYRRLARDAGHPGDAGDGPASTRQARRGPGEVGDDAARRLAGTADDLTTQRRSARR